VRKETLLYENIDCDFFEKSMQWIWASIGESAKEEKIWKYTVILPWWTFTGMKIGDRVELIDPALWSVGKYTITGNPKVFKLPSGVIESVCLFVKQSQNELQQ
jgi:hypothetical protein